MSRRKTFFHNLAGQGLVEYAVILVLATVVVVVVLVLLGPAVGNVFSNITTSLGPSAEATEEGGGDGDGGGEVNVIVSVTATRSGGGHGNSVQVEIVVSEPTTVTVLDSQSGTSKDGPCNGSCTVTIGNVGDEAGQVTVQAAAGGTAVAGYPARD